MKALPCNQVCRKSILVVVFSVIVLALFAGASAAEQRAVLASTNLAGWETVADDFDPDTGFSGNDGSQLWLDAWQEWGEDNGPKIGFVKADRSLYDGCAAGECLMIGTVSGLDITGVGASRGTDLSDASLTTLSFSYRRKGIGSGDAVINLEISTDGVNWSTLASYPLDQEDNTHIPQSFDITTFVSPNTQIRLIGLGALASQALNKSATSAVYMYVDDVEIRYQRSHISGRVWEDGNRDGVWVPGEPGMGDISVHLYDVGCGNALGTPLESRITDGDGAYLFAGLNAGDYCIKLDETLIPVDQAITTGNNPLDVTLTPGTILTTADFGYASVLADARLSVSTYGPCSDIAWLEQIVQRHEASITNRNHSACHFLVEAEADVMNGLAQEVEADEHSRHVDLDVWVRGAYTPNDPLFNDSTYVYAPQQINAESAWDFTLGDPELIVAVLDTGIDLNHPEFTGRILPGYDFVNDDDNPMDDHGHGTHVAGIVAAGIDNNEGIAGMAGNVKVLPVKVLNTYNTGWWSDVSAGITWAVDQGADVINLSLTGKVDSVSLKDAITYANNKGVIVVVAAGNQNSDVEHYPAVYEEVLSLGATTYSGLRWSLSNYGPNVDVLAPGATIYSTIPGGYDLMNGTSMAAPHAAGLAALMLSRNPNLSPQEVKQTILETATDMGEPGVDALHGYGLINAGAAVAAVPVEPRVPPSTKKEAELVVDLSQNGVVDPGDTVRYIISAGNADTQPLTEVKIVDQAPEHTTYIAGSTQLNGIPVQDDPAPASVFPLDEDGLTIGTVGPDSTSRVSFEVVIDTPAEEVFYEIVNAADVRTPLGNQEVKVVMPVGGASCKIEFTNSIDNLVFTYEEEGTIYIELTDADENTHADSAQSVAVVVRNLSNAEEETLFLTEISNDSPVFRGSAPTAIGIGQVSGDGILLAQSGDFLEVRYADADFSPDVCTDMAAMTLPLAVKSLYLSESGLTLSAPLAANDASVVFSPEINTGDTLTYTQTLPMARDFEMPVGGAITITAYIVYQDQSALQTANNWALTGQKVGSRSAHPDITASLQNNGVTFATLLDPVYDETAGTLTWSTALTDEVIIPVGGQIELEITNNEPGVSFRILYDSAAESSRIDLTTSSFVRVENIELYDAPSPGGALLTDQIQGLTAYVRVTASDPFGPSNITSLDLTMIEPSTCDRQTVAILDEEDVIATTASSKSYEYAWDTSPCAGQHSIVAVAQGETSGVSHSAGQYFDIILGAIVGDFIWNDLDGDAIQESGEPGLEKVVVELTGKGSFVTTTTDAEGYYNFSYLRAGVYTITVDTASLPSEFELLTTQYPLVVNLGEGQNERAADYGFKARAISIGDSIWYDANANGRQDPGEYGLGNITLDLWLDDGDGVFEATPALSSDSYVGSTVSNAAGAYRLDVPIAGDYFVDVTDAYGILAGFSHTIGVHSVTEPSPPITVEVGQFYQAVDFGYVQIPPNDSAIIGGIVWADADAQGDRDLEEPIFIQVEVCATSTDVTALANSDSICATTDLNGRYLLEAPPGEYSIAPVDPPAGLALTTSVPHLVTVMPGQQYLKAGFGLAADATPLGTIGGAIWQDIPVADENGQLYVDGIYDPQTESGIPNVSADLIQDLNGDGRWDEGEPYVAAINDAGGEFQFSGLLSAWYLVRVSDTLQVLRNFAPTISPLSGGATLDNVNKVQPYAVDLRPGAMDTTADFGYREYEVVGAVGTGDPPDSGMIGDLVWHDVDGNGVYDPARGDQPLPGVTIELSRAGAGIASVTTGLDGRYLFTNLAVPETYSVQVTDDFGVLAEYIPTALGQDPGLENNNQAQPYVLQLNSFILQDMTADFGYVRLAAIGDFVFLDFNGDGIQQYNEMTGLPDVVVTLHHLATGQEQTKMTNQGTYKFTRLFPGTYVVSVPETLPALRLTSASLLTVTVVSGQSFDKADFGYVAPTAVGVIDFSAAAERTGVLLQWRTIHEQNVLGFAIWRAIAAAGPYKLFSDPIPALNLSEGAAYRWLDASAEPGNRYWYKLEVMSNSGGSTPDSQFLGPVSVKPEPGSEMSRMFMPFLVR